MSIHSAAGAFFAFRGANPPGPEDVPIPVLQHVYIALLKTNVDGSRIVAAFKHTDCIEIYESTSLARIVRGPVFEEPLYKVHYGDGGTSWMSLNNESRYGYADVAVTNSLIFGLYSGLTRTEWPTGVIDHRIAVFNWDGMPLAKLMLPSMVDFISVSPDGRDLYTITLVPVPTILHYSLPAL